MSIQINLKDYVVANIVDKNYLIEVTKISNDTITGNIATVSSDKSEPVTFFSEDVISNLGSKPKSGTTYGIKVEIFNRFLDTNFGKVATFVSLDKASRKEIISEYNKAYKILSDLGLLSFTYTLDNEIRDKSGKMCGNYLAAKNLDYSDKLTYFAHSERGDLSIAEVILHESAHGIWHRLIQQDSVKSKWVEDYSKFIEVESVSDKSIKSHLASLIATGNSFSDYKRDLKLNGDELDQVLFNGIIKYFKEARRLSVKELDYVALYDKDFLQSIWPIHAQDLSIVKQNPISEYAMKNVQEYFAECFRLHSVGKKLPKTTRKLMEKTISSCGKVSKLK